ncbi:Scr1 family TA system antitoxin-like transcriptional regulator [Micromonospora sp. NPDC049230]|uniref:Scr1 family TA system antitoxin-like transcriptional regulator n=1 Tax=Micromonospora sp. NPDC049230 TaxID=3155502 RepID=UPI00340D3799
MQPDPAVVSRPRSKPDHPEDQLVVDAEALAQTDIPRSRDVRILYHGIHRFHFVLAEQALRTMVGDTNVMIGQLDRLLTVLSLPRVRLGILPATHQYRVPSNQFIMFDDRLVHVEAVTAELAVTQPREIDLYAKAFQGLAAEAVYGDTAGELIQQALRAFSSGNRRQGAADNPR